MLGPHSLLVQMKAPPKDGLSDSKAQHQTHEPARKFESGKAMLGFAAQPTSYTLSYL